MTALYLAEYISNISPHRRFVAGKAGMLRSEHDRNVVLCTLLSSRGRPCVSHTRQHNIGVEFRCGLSRSDLALLYVPWQR